MDRLACGVGNRLENEVLSTIIVNLIVQQFYCLSLGTFYFVRIRVFADFTLKSLPDVRIYYISLLIVSFPCKPLLQTRHAYTFQTAGAFANTKKLVTN